MPSTNTRGVQVPVKVEAMVEAVAKARVNIDLNQKADHQATVLIVVQVTLPRGAKHLVKNATIATKRPFPQYCRSKQHEHSPSQTKFNGFRQSRCDVHNMGIDQSQFDDAPQFEQDSVTIEFKHASQWNRLLLLMPCDIMNKLLL